MSRCIKFGGECVVQCDHYPCNVVRAYNEALEDFTRAIIEEPTSLHDNFGCMVKSVKDRLMK